MFAFFALIRGLFFDMPYSPTQYTDEYIAYRFEHSVVVTLEREAPTLSRQLYREYFEKTGKSPFKVDQDFFVFREMSKEPKLVSF